MGKATQRGAVCTCGHPPSHHTSTAERGATDSRCDRCDCPRWRDTTRRWTWRYAVPMELTS